MPRLRRHAVSLRADAVARRPDATTSHDAHQTPGQARATTQRQIGHRGVSGKARTISRYLGRGYTVKASIGHVRDLLRSQMSVDIENDFRPKYRVPNEKRKVVKEIKELAQKAEEIYIATDPDREGEAIAWHLVEAEPFFIRERAVL
jgi:hypothetical protein